MHDSMKHLFYTVIFKTKGKPFKSESSSYCKLIVCRVEAVTIMITTTMIKCNTDSSGSVQFKSRVLAAHMCTTVCKLLSKKPAFAVNIIMYSSHNCSKD